MKVCGIVSPCQGWVSPLSEAPDPVFAEHIMGDGVLVDPTIGEVHAPCDGVIISVADTLHAVTIRAHNSVEILIHVGIDTVALKGAGFTAEVKVGQSVRQGDTLLTFDMHAIARIAKSLVIPIVIINGDDFEIVSRVENQAVGHGDPIMKIRAIAGGAEVRTRSDARIKSVSRQTVRVPLAHGLHARPSARLANFVKQFETDVVLSANGKDASARSTVSLMSLGVKLGDEIEVTASGTDSAHIVDEVVGLITSGLGEVPVAIPQEVSAAPSQKLDLKKSVENLKLDGTETVLGTMGAPGLVCGEVVQLRRVEFNIVEHGAGAVAERLALNNAMSFVHMSLEGEISKSRGSHKDILIAHLALLEDPTLVDGAYAAIDVGKSAGFAWRSVTQAQVAEFQALEDPRMAARADDLVDLEAQILAALSGQSGCKSQTVEAGNIVIAEELLPSQFGRLVKAEIGGICLVSGGPTSHVSILAADNGIPALVAAGPQIRTIPNGTSVILAADKGELCVAPTKDRVASVKKAIKKKRQNQVRSRKHAHDKCETIDGAHIEVFANLGASSEVDNAVKNGAGGCGLLRSEFLFLGRETPPTEDEQLQEYQKIADTLSGRPLVVRTLDIGGDKPVPFVEFDAEENPALGLRGIRISLARPDLLKTQFRALMRIKSEGPIHIMLPMIVSVGEIRKARALLDQVSQELGVKTRASLGVMVETPASAVLANSMATEADFFSIGTNDLTQYALAMDRGNAALAPQLDSLHPAVLNLIKMTAAAGNEHGKWVGVCGALASDIIAIPILIGLGVKELSCTISRLPDVKAFIRTLKLAECQKVAEHALRCDSPGDVRYLVRAHWPEIEEWG